MKPTRVGSFDHEYYNRLKYGGKFYIREAFEANKEELKRTVNKFIERKLWVWEKQIADSHDITKSDYGFR